MTTDQLVELISAEIARQAAEAGDEWDNLGDGESICNLTEDVQLNVVALAEAVAAAYKRD